MRYEAGGETDYQLDQILNGGLSLGDNFEGAILVEDLEIGENEIRHSLGFVPTGYVVLYKSRKGEVWGHNVSNWTTEKLFLGSGVKNQRVRLFVL